MPRQVSPEEALARVKNAPDDATEAIATRVPIRTWRSVAKYAQKHGHKDMSSAYRAILDEWNQIQLLKDKAGLQAFSTEELANVLRTRGKVVLDQCKLVGAFGRELVRFRAKLKRMTDRIMDESKLRRSAERIEKSF